MSKPKTQYSSTTKTQTSWGPGFADGGLLLLDNASSYLLLNGSDRLILTVSLRGDSSTAYAKVAKSATAFASQTKDRTSYSKNPNIATAVRLDDMTVRLDSLSVYLNGYRTPTAPTDSTTPLTAYTEA